MPRLDNSAGKEEGQAVWKSKVDWNLKDKIQTLCYGTTASNTGRFNGSCVLLEQKFIREFFCLPSSCIRAVIKDRIRSEN